MTDDSLWSFQAPNWSLSWIGRHHQPPKEEDWIDSVCIGREPLFRSQLGLQLSAAVS